MDFAAIPRIVDLDRYPLHQPDHPAVKELLRQGRAALRHEALFTLPGFLRPEAAAAMAAEMETRVPYSARYEAQRGSYSDDGKVRPADHPLRIKHRCSYHQVLNHQISNDSDLRRVYCWEPLREFLRQVMGYETFHRSECPHLALSSKVAGEGDVDGWHFDGNDVVFSILLKAPHGGGAFQYLSVQRSDTEDYYDAMTKAFSGDDGLVKTARLAVGDLNVFQGDQTLHRVSPVEGTEKRVVALFCYDRQPGTNFGEPYIAGLRRRSPGPWQTALAQTVSDKAEPSGYQPLSGPMRQ
jgi:hypothetical protein